MREWKIACESEALRSEIVRKISALGLRCTFVAQDRLKEEDHQEEALQAAAFTNRPSVENLEKLRALGQKAAPVAVLIVDRERNDALSLMRSLGLVAVNDVGAFTSVLALSSAGCLMPWSLSRASLNEVQRLQLAPLPYVRRRSSQKLVDLGQGLLGLSGGTREEAASLGEAEDFVQAAEALRWFHPEWRRDAWSPPPVNKDSVIGIIYGPKRQLSDPATKSVLELFGIPTPSAELCLSPSRAASEASRFGFPVRVTLASPDLRIWDHPEFRVDNVDNAARVREVFRQMVELARDSVPESRILGVSVGPNTPARALLRVHMTWRSGFVWTDVAFDDPHGHASLDRVTLALPNHYERASHILSQLRGWPLIERESALLIETLQRAASLVAGYSREVESLQMRPIAINMDSTLEVREASLAISDAFTRDLQTVGVDDV